VTIVADCEAVYGILICLAKWHTLLGARGVVNNFDTHTDVDNTRGVTKKPGNG